MTRRSRSTSSSSGMSKKFNVFEFNEDDERIEEDSAHIVNKFSNPRKKPRTSPITKYHFLQNFARGSEPPAKNVTVDPILLCESDDEDECLPEKPCDKPFEVNDDDDGGGGGDVRDYQDTFDDSCSIDVTPQDSADGVIPDFVDSDIELKNQSLDKVSGDDDSSQISPSTSTSTVNPSQAEVFLDDKLAGHGSTACDIDGHKKVVRVLPDFIRYEDLHSTCSQLIFSCSSLKLEVSKINGTDRTFEIEWVTEDIERIESWWFGKVETAMINILLKPKDSREAGNTNENPGFKLLRLAVYDPYWAKTEQSIKLLDTKYADLWSTIFDIDTYNNGNISMGQDSFFSQKRYFPTFDEAFDEVIFPKGEPDAVAISKRDVELLQPGTFINDTIIDFYIKYLKNKIPPDEQGRFHFFNSFFFRKLADLDKDPSSACNGKAAFQRVRKWTRKVNLFEKDYIFIPVNYSLHWSLIVICHPGEVISFRDEDMEESSKLPCVLHMDSLKGSHKGLKNVFQSYLGEEWKARNTDVEDGVFSKFLHMRFVSLELPQQDNFYDCGIFLLHYVERFLTEAPINFNPFKITKFSNFCKSNWFPPLEASLKRSHIQNLIYDIFDDNSLQAPSADCIDKYTLSEAPGIVEHIQNPCTEQETDIQFPAVSPVRVASCKQRVACFQGSFMSPIEEIEESGEETASLEIEDFHVAILTSDLPSAPCIRKDYKLSKTSSAYWNTLATGAHEDRPLEKSEMFDILDKTDALNYLSTSSEELADSFVQDSQEEKDGHDDVSESAKSHFLFRGNKSSVTHQIFDLEEDASLGDDTLVGKKELSAFESDERDAGRPELMNAGGQRRQFTRKMSKKERLLHCE